ncbi:MAG: hypothetical protein RJA19_1255 [Bacteroidota bacterium]
MAGLLAAGLAAWALGRLQERVPVAEVTDWMGDGFSVWEQWDGRATQWIPYPWLQAQSGSLSWEGEWLALGGAGDAQGLGIRPEWSEANAQGMSGVRQVERWNPAVVTRFRGDSAGVELWHIFPPEEVDVDQTAQWNLAPGWEVRIAHGGILLGTTAAWAMFSDVPGEMATAWHGRRHGYNRLGYDQANGLWSTYFVPVDEEGHWGAWTGTEWATGLQVQSEVGAAVLPAEWSFLTGLSRRDWSEIRVQRMAIEGPEPDTLLVGRWNGTAARLVGSEGGMLEWWGWTDTVGLGDAYAAWGVRVDSLPGGYEVDGTGLLRWSGEDEQRARMRERWLAARSQQLSGEDLTQWDGWRWDGRLLWKGSIQPGGRMAWTTATASGGGRGGQAVAAALPPIPEPVETEVTVDADGGGSGPRVMGEVRNHRTGGKMTCRWENGKIQASEGGAMVWEVEASVATVPFHQVVEVDLYRNGKYQTAYAQPTTGMHLVDVLGREAAGFPLRAGNSKVTAWCVADYDRDRQFRFLVAFEDGSLRNWRDEGQPTPGWNFTPGSHGPILYIEPIRVGSKDYLFAAHKDGYIRLLSRSGEDRATTPVRFPAGQIPAFRLGATIESTSVLYFDERGELQERTLGDNRPVGLNGKAKGDRVKIEDTDGDGKPEVVVLQGSTRRVFNARNEEIR